MKMQQYIINKLNELVSVFPKLKLTYFIDDFTNSNHIKVLPSGEFNTNEKFQKFEVKIILEFIKKYPYDEIFFFSDDSFMDGLKPIYEVKGKLYNYNINIGLQKPVMTLNRTVREVVDCYDSLSNIRKNIDITLIQEEPSNIQKEYKKLRYAA